MDTSVRRPLWLFVNLFKSRSIVPGEVKARSKVHPVSPFGIIYHGDGLRVYSPLNTRTLSVFFRERRRRRKRRRKKQKKKKSRRRRRKKKKRWTRRRRRRRRKKKKKKKKKRWTRRRKKKKKSK